MASNRNRVKSAHKRRLLIIYSTKRGQRHVIVKPNIQIYVIFDEIMT